MARLLLRDLTPGTVYKVQLRAVNEDTTSEWSRLFDIPVSSDTTPPDAPTWATQAWVVDGDTFVASWNAIDPQTANNLDFSHYELELSDGTKQIVVRTNNTSYTLTFDQNRIFFDTAKATVTSRVRTVDAVGNASNWTTTQSASNPPPTAVTNLSVTPLYDSIQIGWSQSPDLDVIAYKVQVSLTSASSGFNDVYNGPNNAYTHQTIQFNTDHWIRVYAVDKFGSLSSATTSGAVRPKSSFAADTTPPAVPTGLTASIVNNANGLGARATLAWAQVVPNPNDLAGFRVRWRKVGDTNYSQTDFSHEDRGGIIELQAAHQNYEFQIRSYDWMGNYSAWSATVTATSPVNAAPADIASMTASPGKDSIAYSWTPVADTDLKEYEVTFSTSSTFASGNTTFRTGTAATLNVGGLSPSTTYYARVRAIDTGGLTSASWSTTNTSATTAFPLTPLSDGNAPASSPTPTVTGGIGNLNISWTPVVNNDLVTYEVHISTTTGFTPAAGTKAAEVMGTTVTLEKDGAGTNLAYGTTYYVKTIAKDRDGAAAASAQASGTISKVGSGDSTLTAGDVGAPTTTDHTNLTNEVATKSTNFYSTGTVPTALKVGDTWTLESGGTKKLYVAKMVGANEIKAGEWELSQDSAGVQNWALSRGTDLVTNGTGYLKNNTNFTQHFTANLEDAPPGATAAFYSVTTGSTAAFPDELIPFDPAKSYKFSFQARQTVPGIASRMYGMLVPYDAQGNQISPSHTYFWGGTTTTLAAPLNNGDTTVQLTSAANWWGAAGNPAGASTHNRSIIFWNWTDANGKVWPQHTYSRNYWLADAWADGGISGNTITLNAPWAGGSFAAGHPISNGSSGGTFAYMSAPAQNFIAPETWTTYSEVYNAGIRPTNTTVGNANPFGWTVGLPPGTANIKIGWLFNRDVAGGRHAVAAVSFSDASAAQVTADAAIKTYVTEYSVHTSETVAPTTGWSTATPTRTPGTFIWYRVTVTRNDNTTSTTSPALLTGNTGADGGDGAPAPVITLAATTQVLTQPATGGATAPTTAQITGSTLNTTIPDATSLTAGWSYAVDGGAFSTTIPAGLSRTGGTVTITGGSMTNKTIAVKATNAGVSDTITIARVSNGATGTGITITSTSVKYAKHNSGTTPPPAGNFVTSPIPATTTGEFLWSRTVVNYSDGSSTTTDAVSAHGSAGTAGRGITSTTITYAKNTDGTTAPAAGSFVASPIPVTSTGEFLWTKTTYNYSDGGTDNAYSVAAHGQTGAAGKGISGTAVKYIKDTQGTTPPATGAAWGTTIPSTVAGEYLWTWTRTTYTDSATSDAYSVAAHGAKGDIGADGVGISGTVVAYAKSTNGTTAPAVGSFVTSPIPTTSTGEFLWTQTEITYTDNTKVYAYSVAAHGAAGADAYTVVMSNEAMTFPGSTTAALAGSETTTITAYKGATQQNVSIGTITGQTAGQITAAVNTTNPQAPVITVSVTTALTAQTGTLTVPVTVDDKVFNKVISWSVSRKGDPGVNATSIDLTATSQILTAPATGGTTNPASTTITGTATNTTITHWDYSVDGGAWTALGTTGPAGVTRSGNVVTVTGTSFVGKTFTVRMANGASGGTASDTLTVAKVSDGAAGGAGADGYTILLTNEAQVFAGTTTTAVADNTKSTSVIAYKGSVQQSASITQANITGLPNGMTAAVTNSPGTSPTVTFTVTTAMTSASGSVTIPVVVGGITFNKVFSYSIAFKGTTGDTGGPGTPGVSVTGIKPWYARVNTGTTPTQPPDGTVPVSPWQDTEPAWTDGTELWRTDAISYSSGTTPKYTLQTKVATYGAITTAITAANGKNQVIFSNVDASGTARNGVNYIDGDLWYKRDANGVIIATWEFVAGTGWVSRTFGDATLSSLNVGKLVSGDVSAITINIKSTGEIKSDNYVANTTGFRLSAAGLDIRSGTVAANTLVAGTGIVNNLVVETGGAIQSSVFNANAGWKISPGGIEMNDAGSSIKADAIKAGTLGGTSGSGIINVAAGTSLVMNGGTLRSNTYGSTTYNANATAGFFLSDGNLHIPDGNISAKALKAGQITGTNTIELVGASAKIKGGTWELSGSGLSIPDGGIAAKSLNIAVGNNLLTGEWANLEGSRLPLSVNAATIAFDTTNKYQGDKAVRVSWSGTTGARGFLFSSSTSEPKTPVEVGKSYYISAWARNNTTTPTTVSFGYVNSAGAYTSAGITNNTVSVPSSASGWVRVWATLVVPAGTTSITPYITNAATAFDVTYDCLQVEEKLGAAAPGPWVMSSYTTIDGGMIRTGTIRSTAVAQVWDSTTETYKADPDNQPAWVINMSGTAQFGDTLVRGNMIVGYQTNPVSVDETKMSTLSSATYIPGEQGWQLRADGSAELRTLDADSLHGGALIAGTVRAEVLTSGTMSADLSLAGTIVTASNSTDISIRTTDASATITLDATEGAAFTASDVGLTIAGPGIRPETTIASVTNSTTAVMNKTATATVASPNWVTASILRGRNIRISGQDGIVLSDATNIPLITLPTNPDERATFAGSIVATDLFVNDEFRMFGQDNALGSGSQLHLEGGLYKPGASPSASFDWETTYLRPALWAYNGSDPNEKFSVAENPYYPDPTGVSYDPADQRYYFVNSFWGSYLEYFDSTFEKNFSGVLVSDAYLNAGDDHTKSVGFTADNFYFLTEQGTTGTWRVQVISRANVWKSDGPVPADRIGNTIWSEATNGGIVGKPAMYLNGGFLYIAKLNSSGNIVIYKYASNNPANAPTIATDTGIKGSGGIASITVGQFDYGTGGTYIAVNTVGTNSAHRRTVILRDFGSSVGATSWHFPTPYERGDSMGAVWVGTSTNDASGRFVTLTKNTHVFKYTQLGHAAASSKSIKIHQRWRYDGSDPSFTTATIGPAGPVATVAYKKRSRLTLASKTSIPSTNPPGPNAVTFYMGLDNGTVYRYDEQAKGKTSMVITQFRTSNAAGTSTAMANGVPSKILSAAGLSISGDGLISSANPMAKLSASATQNMSSDVWYALSLAATAETRGSILTSVTYVEVVVAGWYLCSGAVNYGSGGSGKRVVRIEKYTGSTAVGSGTFVAGSEMVAASLVQATPSATGLVYCNVGDRIRLAAKHIHGSVFPTGSPTEQTYLHVLMVV